MCASRDRWSRLAQARHWQAAPCRLSQCRLPRCLLTPWRPLRSMTGRLAQHQAQDRGPNWGPKPGLKQGQRPLCARPAPLLRSSLPGSHAPCRAPPLQPRAPSAASRETGWAKGRATNRARYSQAARARTVRPSERSQRQNSRRQDRVLPLSVRPRRQAGRSAQGPGPACWRRAGAAPRQQGSAPSLAPRRSAARPWAKVRAWKPAHPPHQRSRARHPVLGHPPAPPANRVRVRLVFALHPAVPRGPAAPTWSMQTGPRP